MKDAKKPKLLGVENGKGEIRGFGIGKNCQGGGILKRRINIHFSF
jgi:hypothetical protein